MDMPGFERAEYVEPQVIDAYQPADSMSFAKACIFGLGAAIAGSLAMRSSACLDGWSAS
jgi:hypothetical protein